MIPGISTHLLASFKHDVNLKQALAAAAPLVRKGVPHDYQTHVLNFYNPHTIVPFTPVSAKGPWMVASNGAVLYDVGGYGMLGFGHAPDWSLATLAKPHVMANVMTPSPLQERFTDTIRSKIGVNRPDGCPYSHFAFLNSGSESMELATRISDIKRSDRPSYHIVLKDGFHGRTGRASTLSDSSRATYQRHLRSFHAPLPVETVEVNDVNQFRTTFEAVSRKGCVEAVFMEPVMGEGNPGICLSQEFYHEARRLTHEHGSDLVIDSVQAGLRGTGYLSVVDYPHLANEAPPDMEVFSKAISSGQFPLSVLAMRAPIAERFPPGLYGNTMTGNPKALEIGCETLARVDSELTANIRERGEDFKRMLEEVADTFPKVATHVTGSGLLLALHICSDYTVDVEKGLEYICRTNGLNVIHGGANALRFTPHFLITEEEIGLVRTILEQSLASMSMPSNSK